MMQRDGFLVSSSSLLLLGGVLGDETSAENKTWEGPPNNELTILGAALEPILAGASSVAAAAAAAVPTWLRLASVLLRTSVCGSAFMVLKNLLLRAFYYYCLFPLSTLDGDCVLL